MSLADLQLDGFLVLPGLVNTHDHHRSSARYGTCWSILRVSRTDKPASNPPVKTSSNGRFSGGRNVPIILSHRSCPAVLTRASRLYQSHAGNPGRSQPHVFAHDIHADLRSQRRGSRRRAANQGRCRRTRRYDREHGEETHHDFHNPRSRGSLFWM